MKIFISTILFLLICIILSLYIPFLCVFGFPIVYIVYCIYLSKQIVLKKIRYILIRYFLLIFLFFIFYGFFSVVPSMRQYHYESTNRRYSDFEMPGKGRTLKTVYHFFNEYVECKGDTTLELMRTTKRSCFILSDWLPHERWSIPYMKPSDEPKYERCIKGKR